MQLNLVDGLAHAAKSHPEQPALVFEGRTISYGELWTRSAAVARGLTNVGVVRGDRIAVFLPNSPEFVAVYYGIVRLGAVVVSINAMSKAAEVGHVVRDCAATVLITTGELMANVPSRSEIPTVRAIFADEANDATVSLTSLIQGPPDENPPLALQRDAPAAILYTSGTTGQPKGAVLSHGNVIFNAETTGAAVGVRRDDVALCFLPLSHCFGQNSIMNVTLLAGATCVLQRRFVPEDALAACVAHGVTLFFAVPTVYIALLARPLAPASLSGIRYYFSAAATLPTQVERSWYERTGIHIHEGYGLTETSPGASYNHVRAWKSGSVGAPVAGVQMRVVDALGRPLAAGEIGEICIKGPNVMLGYYGREDESKRAIVDGWFHSGDIGYHDGDGDYFIVDRLKDMINVSGFKVWPREVEEVLFRHGAVRESAVVGMPDAYSGEAVKAFIVLNKKVSVEELKAHCRAWLSAYKVPKQLELVDSLPRNATGKVLKTTLRTLGVQTPDADAV